MTKKKKAAISDDDDVDFEDDSILNFVRLQA